MYQAYSDSRFVIHDNNFASFCKPHLRHLPATTAVELQTARERLENIEGPPYTPIQLQPLPPPTVPSFSTTLAEQARQSLDKAPTANRTHPRLRPRAQWMKDTPPIMPDDEADAAYSAACSWMFGTSAVASSAAALPPAVLGTNRHDQNDFRHPANEFHAAGQKLRGRIGMVLRNREYIREFKREDIPTPQRSPTTHRRLTALLKNRDRVEEDLYLLHCDTDANGAPADPKRDIEPEYKRLCAKLNDINRNMFQVYMDHLAPFEVDTEPSRIDTSASTTQSRVFRQGVQGNTADENEKQTSSQSSSTNTFLVRKEDAQTTFLQPEKTSSQLKSSENLFFPHTAQTKKTPGQINPSVRVPSLGQGLSRSSEAIRQAMDHTSEPSPPRHRPRQTARPKQNRSLTGEYRE